MAANIQWELWDCGNGPGDTTAKVPAVGTSFTTPPMRGLWAKMLHNEREVPFPACTNADYSHGTARGGDAAPAWRGAWGGGGSNTAAAPWGLIFPCPWDAVKRFYREQVYGKLGLGACDAVAWRQNCGGVSLETCVAEDRVNSLEKQDEWED
jgi:hypothetical protein